MSRVRVDNLPGGLVLRERDGRLDVLLGGHVLLSSAALETELAFGALVGELVPCAKRIAIGGLGFAATLRGVLGAAGRDAEVIVVEKLPAIVDLARARPDLVRGALDDPRVRLRVEDVADFVAGARELDALLLDVDNGPGWASFRTNARLYSPAGVAVAARALAPGGVCAVWSGYPDDAFLGRLRAAGLRASLLPLKERGVVRARAYVGRRPA